MVKSYGLADRRVSNGVAHSVGPAPKGRLRGELFCEALQNSRREIVNDDTLYSSIQFKPPQKKKRNCLQATRAGPTMVEMEKIHIHLIARRRSLDERTKNPAHHG